MKSGEFSSRAFAAIVWNASSGMTPVKTGTPGLTISAFSPAILARVLPRAFMWSKAMLVMTEAAGVTTLVASRRPPMPVSQTTMSQRASAKSFIASTVAVSK